MFRRMQHHALKRVFSRLLAKLAVEGDISAHQRLQTGAEGAEDGSRPDHDAAHNAEVADDAEAGKLQRRGHHGGMQAIRHTGIRSGWWNAAWVCRHVVSPLKAFDSLYLGAELLHQL